MVQEPDSYGYLSSFRRCDPAHRQHGIESGLEGGFFEMKALQLLLKGVAARFLASPFKRKIAALSGYLFLGQLIYLAATPLISRLFSPEDFGLFGMVFTFVVTASVLSSLNYEAAIPVPKQALTAAALVRGALLISTGTALVLAFFITAAVTRNWFHFGKLTALAALLAGVLMFAQALLQILQSARVRDEDLLRVGQSGLFSNASRALAHLLLGFSATGWVGLMIGETIGRCAASWKLASKPRFSIWGEAWKTSWADVRQALREYRHFPMVLLPAQVIDSAVPFAVLTAVAGFYGPVAAGHYFLMRRVLDVPLALVFRTLADAFFGRIAALSHAEPKRVRQLLVKFSMLTFCLGVLANLPLIIAGQTLFAVVFGEAWREAGLIAALMAPAAVLQTAVTPITRIFTLTQKPQLRWVYTIFQVVLLALSFLAITFFSLSMISGVLLISASIAVSYAIYFFAAYVASGFIVPQVEEHRAP
jgi:O-antigen/teichoic acid export membrane protein